MSEEKSLRDQLREKYGDDALVVEKPQGTFVFGRPTAIAYARWRAGVAKKNADAAAQAAATAQLCNDCLLYPQGADGKPDYAAVRALFEAWPAIPDNLADKLVKLAGGGEDDVGPLGKA